MGYEFNEKTADPAAREVLEKASKEAVETGWDRFQAMQELCAFGELGLCCRHCMMGPCRIDPFGEGPQKGICGISADGMVARNLCRMVSSGTSAHGDHGAHIREVLHAIREGREMAFHVTDAGKLERLAKSLGVFTDGDLGHTLGELLSIIDRTYSNFSGECDWWAHILPEKRLARLRELNLLPPGVDPVIRETMHRTHVGVDADPVNLIMGGLKCALADFLCMDMASNMSDILLGTPGLTMSRANLGVLDAEAVNIAVHGHNPLVVESILRRVPHLQEQAREAGAKNGLNIVGICCTGNEVLHRHGTPLATNFASQELAILTGALDAMVVDVQCVMPSLAAVCKCQHTRLFTTAAIARIPGAEHIEMNPENAGESADRILSLAIEAFRGRYPRKVDIPAITQEALVGFSVETILEILGKVDPEDPLAPFMEKIAEGSVFGAVLMAGCNNYKVPQDSAFISLSRRLAAENVLVLATGCAAGALAKAGLMSPTATRELCGSPLMEVLQALGRASGRDEPLPPVWHMGSCVDNSRAARLAFALANKMGVDVSQLPLVASAPEAMSEKSMSIGMCAVALGLTTHLGVVPPVMGGKSVTRFLTENAQDVLGACFIVETDPDAAFQKIMETLTRKRLELGLSH